jgi:hypothetical protein
MQSIFILHCPLPDNAVEPAAARYLLSVVEVSPAGRNLNYKGSNYRSAEG